MKDILEELKTKFVEDLEECLQCPICMLAKPNVKIFQCTKGHHLCETCTDKLLNDECPTCKTPFDKNVRCLIAEKMLKNMNETTKSISNLVSSVIQVKMAVETSTQYSEFDFLPVSLHLSAPKGTFPCKIGACTKREPHCRMMEHIRINHKNKMKMGTGENKKTYTTTWNIDYSPATDYDFALHITDMELFFVHMSSDNEGNFIGNIQIVNTNERSSIFTYKLQLKGNNQSCSYENSILSCQSPSELLNEKSLHVHHECIKIMLKDEKTLECVLVINRHDEKLNVEKENGAKKKRIKKTKAEAAV